MATVTSQSTSNAFASYTPTDTAIPAISTQNAVGVRCAARFTNGTAADQIDLYHRKTYPLAAAATVLNLFDGSILDLLGLACSFARIRRIRIKILSEVDGDTLTLGYGTTTANAWTALISNPGTLTLRAATASNDAWFEIVCPSTTGWEVSSTSHLLRLDPGSSTFDCIVEIEGCSD